MTLTMTSIPVSRVDVFRDWSSLCQFRGIGALTRSGEYQWNERTDGILVHERRSRNDGLPTDSLLIDRTRRIVTSTYRERGGDGSVIINHNWAIDTAMGEGWGQHRTEGDVGERFDELVGIVLQQIAERA